MELKKILLFACCLAAAGCGREKVTEHAFYDCEFFTAAVPAGYLPVAENRAFIAEALSGAGAPKEAVEMMLSAPAGAYFNPATLAMASYSGRRIAKPCGELYAALKGVNGGRGEMTDIAGTEWLLLQRDGERVAEFHACSGGAVSSAVFADPAGNLKDLRAFAAETLRGFKRK